MRFGLTILRMLIGGLFFGHGAQKLFGAFGGHGVEATGEAFEQMGMRPGRRNAIAAGVSEAGGGLLLAAGAATPLAGAALTGTMSTAMWKVHREKGVWNTEGGYEYNLVLVAAIFAIVAEGPGALALPPRRGGLGWAFAQLAAGMGGAAVAMKLAESHPEESAAQPPTAPGANGAMPADAPADASVA